MGAEPAVAGVDPGSAVTAVMDHETGIVEVAVRGHWSRKLSLTSNRVFQKCLAEHPAGIALDLAGLHDPRAVSAPFWFTVAVHGQRLQPAVPVTACLPPGCRLAERLERMGAERYLPVYGTIGLARTAITSHRPTTSQVRLQLPPTSASVRNARQIVTAACTEWDMPDVRPRALLVVSELVANAVVHVGGTIDVVISHRGTLRRAASRGSTSLHLAVYDQGPPLPPPNGNGMGLRLVAVAAQSWGSLPTHSGKVVWAILREAAAPD